MTRYYPELLPGDIAAVKGSGVFAWLSNKLLKPHTDRFHFFIICQAVQWDNDYLILESIGKGIAIGRLSFYNDYDLEIYRVKLDEMPESRWGKQKKTDYNLLRLKACTELARIGRARYDYLLYAQLLLGALRLMLSFKFPPYDPAQLPYGRNKDYVCTEAANYGWRKVGHPIIEENTVPVPAGFRKALDQGKLEKIYP